MAHASGWLIQFAIVSFVALFAGPLLSKLPFAEHFPLPLLGLTGPQTIRLIAEGTGLLTLWLLAFHAFRNMPDNGRGFTFLSRTILPLITIVVLIVALPCRPRPTEQVPAATIPLTIVVRIVAFRCRRAGW